MRSHSPARPRSAPTERQRRGAAAEECAARRLIEAGFVIVARNYRCRAGELDIVARRGRLLVIAEVRLRASSAFGGAACSITAAKRRRLWIAARHLLARRPALADLSIRFDALLASSPDGPLEWLEAVM